MMNKNEWVIIEMCLLKEIGRQRMDLLSDVYILSEEITDKKDLFIESIEKIQLKIQDIIQDLDNEDLK